MLKRRSVARKDEEDRELIKSLADWLSAETDVADITPSTLSSHIEEGVVLCKLMQRFGHVLRYSDPPKNEFKRRENLALFERACQRLGLGSTPIPKERNLTLKDYAPCLMELEILQKKNFLGASFSESTSATASNTNSSPNAAGGNSGGGVVEEEMECTEFSFSPRGDKEELTLRVVKDSLACLSSMGGQVLIKYLSKQEGKSFAPEELHQVICVGLPTAIPGLYTSMCGADAVLLDSSQNIHMMTKNMMMNAHLVSSMKGSCGARMMKSNKLGEEISKMMLDEAKTTSCNKLTVLVSDYSHSWEEIGDAAVAITKLQPDARFIAVCRHDNPPSSTLKQQMNQLQQVFGDMEYRIFKSGGA